MDLGSLRVYQTDHKLLGVNIGARMTVIKLNNDDLFVHSPIPLTAEIRQNIDDFGLVKWVVAPNDFHHLFIKDCMAIYLNAEYVGSPGLRNKRPDLKFARYFNNDFNPPWKEEIDFLVYRGSKSFHEVVFFHRQSSSLILTDLAMNFQGEFGPLSTLILSMLGTYHQLNTSRIVKLLTKNKVLARETIDKIQQWSFQRIIISHGEIVEEDAAKKMANAFAWL